MSLKTDFDILIM